MLVTGMEQTKVISSFFEHETLSFSLLSLNLLIYKLIFINKINYVCKYIYLINH